jgi:hypothetical protein
MASYKDNAPLQFSPYVQTLPVEAMAKVGMYKQQRYDEGVQKIQQSIDNIAGLDIVRPEDKQYLQSKLNQLGSQLSMVAGGDFSNFSLVNSVNGMTNQIAKDPSVTRAVSNTARYKKDLATVDKLNSEGKWAPSNQAAFQKDVNKWFNGGKDANYNANVSPYVDVTKDSVNIIKGLAKKYTQNDVAVETDENGRITGVYDAITRTKIEGVTKERIASALKTGLSPQAYRQLSIDGEYKYSSTSPEEFISSINSSYQKSFQELNERRQELTSSLVNLSPSQQAKANQEIELLDKSATQLKNEYDSLSRGFEQGEVDGAKAQYYTMNFIDNVSNAYSSKSVSRTFHTSPWKTQENFERKMKQIQDNSDREYALQLRKEQREIRKEKREEEGLFAPLTLPTDTEKSGAERTNAEIKKDALARTEAAKDQVKATKLKLNNLGLTDEDITKYQDNPNAITDSNKRMLLEQYNTQVAEKNRLLLQDERIKKMADEVHKLPLKDELIPTISNSENFIYGRDGSGALLYHTIGDGDDALDVYDIGILIDMFDDILPSTVSGTSSFGATSSYRTYPTELAKKTLTPLQYKLYEMYIDPNKEQVDVGYNTLNNSNILDRNQFDNLLKGAREVQQSMGVTLNKQNDWIADQYVQREQINLVKTSKIDKDNFIDVESTLNDFISIAKSADSDMLSTGISANDITNAMGDGIKTARIYTDQTGNGQQGLLVNGVKLPLPVEQFEEFTRGRFKPSPQMQYYNDNILPYLIDTLPELIEVNKKNEKGKDVVDANGNIVKETTTKQREYYTTSIDDEYNVTPWNAMFSTNKGSFPQLKDSYKIYVNFNSITDPNDKDPLVAQVLVLDPLDGQAKTLNFTMPPEKTAEFFNLQTPDGRPALEQLIYGTLYRDEILEGTMAKNINDATVETTNGVESYKNLLKRYSEQLDN